ncbi:MAG: hypothetical protein P4L83_06720, partial [Nevskia sp.]|nr:hypothetical protein [Nevskia sp.]
GAGVSVPLPLVGFAPAKVGNYSVTAPVPLDQAQLDWIILSNMTFTLRVNGATWYNTTGVSSLNLTQLHAGVNVVELVTAAQEAYTINLLIPPALVQALALQAWAPGTVGAPATPLQTLALTPKFAAAHGDYTSVAPTRVGFAQVTLRINTTIADSSVPMSLRWNGTLYQQWPAPVGPWVDVPLVLVSGWHQLRVEFPIDPTGQWQRVNYTVQVYVPLPCDADPCAPASATNCSDRAPANSPAANLMVDTMPPTSAPLPLAASELAALPYQCACVGGYSGATCADATTLLTLTNLTLTGWDGAGVSVPLPLVGFAPAKVGNYSVTAPVPLDQAQLDWIILSNMTFTLR